MNIEDNRLRASYRRDAEAQSFLGFVGANSFALGVTPDDGHANEFAPTLTALPTIGAFLRASAVNPFFINYQGILRLLRSHLVSGSHASRSCATCEGAISNIPTPRSSARM